MFECRLNEFIVKIMQEYNAALGLNNPPPTAQLLNAIGNYIKYNTLKKITVNLDENSKSLIVVAEKNDGTSYTTSVDLSSLGGGLDVYSLKEFLVGSDTVIVDINEDNTKIEIHLDSEVVAKIDRALLMPVSAPTDIELVAVDTAKQQRGIRLSPDFNISDDIISNRTRLVNVVIDNAKKAVGANTYNEVTFSFGMLIDLNELENVRNNVVELVNAAFTHPSFGWHEYFDEVKFTPINWFYYGHSAGISYYDDANDVTAKIEVTEDAVISEIEIV